MSVKVVARFVIKEDMRDEALRIAGELAAATREEAGCVSYILHESREKPGMFAFLEEWASSEALEQHLASEHFTRLAPQLDGTMEENLPLETYTVLL